MKICHNVSKSTERDLFCFIRLHLFDSNHDLFTSFLRHQRLADVTNECFPNEENVWSTISSINYWLNAGKGIEFCLPNLCGFTYSQQLSLILPQLTFILIFLSLSAENHSSQRFSFIIFPFLLLTQLLTFFCFMSFYHQFIFGPKTMRA